MSEQWQKIRMFHAQGKATVVLRMTTNNAQGTAPG